MASTAPSFDTIWQIRILVINIVCMGHIKHDEYVHMCLGPIYTILQKLWYQPIYFQKYIICNKFIYKNV